MITEVKINDNSNAPFYYLKDIFNNGTEFNFSPDINIIVGPNGSGKSTLINLICEYSLCAEHIASNQAEFGSNRIFKDVFKNIMDDNHDKYRICNGVDVYGDYKRPVFVYRNMNDSSRHGNPIGDKCGFNGMALMVEGKHSSNGESVIMNMNFLFDFIHHTDKNFDFDKRFDSLRVKCPDKITILLDEPDKGIDIYNLKYLYDILSKPHPDYQIIASIHNPLLIYKLQQFKHINWIDLSADYLNNINKEFN